jgi:hypothetical protein
MEPPRSVPMPIGEAREQTSPPSPPELPPVDRAGSHGFAALPHIAFYDSIHSMIYGMLDLTNGIAPASRSTVTMAASSLSGELQSQLHPVVESVPLTDIISLMETGMPCSGPQVSGAVSS